MERIYLDCAATTPVRAEVLEAMLPHFSEAGYNPNSTHAEGRNAREALDGARERIAAILGCKPREIVFTGSGSESDNLAIAGIARAASARGKHVVTSRVEHRAVLRACEALRDEGFEITELEVDGRGRVDPAAFAPALRGDTVFAAIMYANNEIGTVQPVAELARIARSRGVRFFTDAIQAPGQLPMRVDALEPDALSISAHKLYGPKGVGALYLRAGTALSPLVHGGGQEFGLRSGTENVPGIVGLAAALELAEAERPEFVRRVGALRDRLEARILGAIPGAAVNGAGGERLANNLSVSFPGLTVEPLLIALDLEGVACSAGSACAAGSLEPSHVVAALNPPADRLRGILRFSLGRQTSEAEVDRAAAIVAEVVTRQRGLSGAFSSQARRLDP